MAWPAPSGSMGLGWLPPSSRLSRHSSTEACKTVEGAAGGIELVRELERQFLPSLRAAEAEINASVPGVQAGAWSQPHGQATDSPGHVIALSCCLADAPPDQPDEVTLELCFGGVTGPTPTFEADVVWGHPGQVEADLFPGPVPLTEDALRIAERELPRLIQALWSAVRRGGPSGQTDAV